FRENLVSCAVSCARALSGFSRALPGTLVGLPVVLLFPTLLGLPDTGAATNHRDLAHAGQFPVVSLGLALHLTLQPQYLGRLVLLLRDVGTDDRQERRGSLVVVEFLHRDVLDVCL